MKNIASAFFVNMSDEPGRVGKAMLIGREDKSLAVNYARAAELLGMKLVYMEAGSGAPSHISANVIKEVKKSSSIPVIVGGGIRTPLSAKEICNAGADIIVTGTIAEQAVDVYSSLPMSIALPTLPTVIPGSKIMYPMRREGPVLTSYCWVVALILP